MAAKTTLSPDEMLSAEFKYISQTAFQANEDRARVASFYLVTFGSFIAALVTYQFGNSALRQDWLDFGFALLFFALALMGLMTVLQLARLRMAWFESVTAMNAIKEYYIEQLPDLARAIQWRNTVKPNRFKLNSVSFLMVLQVAVLGAAALVGALFFLIRAVSGNNLVWPAVLAGAAFLYIQFEAYRSALQ